MNNMCRYDREITKTTNSSVAAK
uniref:Uncharacterized protein n=1 Tax=Arundo donax TaxID=35708 RepID=A0A0A9BSL8_ARUDO